MHCTPYSCWECAAPLQDWEVSIRLCMRVCGLIVIMSRMRCMQLLGGRVDELYEAWEFQNRFGSSARPAAAADAAAELDRPPQFKMFVPGKTRVPKRLPADAGTNGHRCTQPHMSSPTVSTVIVSVTWPENISGLTHELPGGRYQHVRAAVVPAVLT